MPAIEVCRASAQDIPGMVALSETHYQDHDTNFPDHFQWRYVDNPDGPAIIVVCKDMDHDGLVVGRVAAIPRQARIGGQPILLGLVTDLLVHPNYRRQGVGTQLLQRLFDECRTAGKPFSYAVANPLSHAITKKLEILTIGQAPLLIQPIDLRGFSGRLGRIPMKQGLLSLLHTIYTGSGWGRGGRRGERSDVVVREIEHFGDPFDDFWTRIQEKRAVMIERTAKYLDWRFGDVPQRSYRKWVAEKNGRVQGYIVGRIMDVKQVSCGMIADLVIEENDAGWEAGNSLITALVTWLKQERVALSGCLMLPGTSEYRLLRKRGYVVCPPRLEPQPFPIVHILHRASAPASLAQDVGNWFFTMGDYDVI